MTHSETDQKNSRFSRALAMFCFALAGALLIMSLVQATSAGAGQARHGFQLPESRVFSTYKAPQQTGSASLGDLLTGPATR